MDIITDPSFRRNMGTGMALISTLAVNNIMALCGSTGYPDQHGFGGGMALGPI